MNVLDLFSGIGGFSLGLERAGMRTVAFCEIAPYCRKVLAKHWPDVPVFDDVRTLTAEALAYAAFPRLKTRGGDRLRTEEPPAQQTASHGGCGIDVICGGFPCQDISLAGKGAGITGERSGLWKEYARIIGEVRPRYVIVENVAALLSRGLGDVLGDLAALGYDAEWHCIPASAVGAPHRRDRIWIVANARGGRCGGTAGGKVQQSGRAEAFSGSEAVADSHSDNRQRGCGTMQMGRLRIAREIADYGDAGRTQWEVEPDVGRVAHGVPSRVDRLKALGNAVIPQIPEIIGRAIMKAEGL